ncbi:hypothetical protein BDEG_20578 [Batrachochytrium dendrobatidis JEL423]|uniref:Peptidase A1 domain-containing protein n=1 Tax=Batrachochytrium dendrobatidis (strain JEL423) TaxID=403673 RepID=A0A177W9V1_BATDL|nr:hypothetical protein BDEG_20578 [Batrachochytrium dendrobatidis JEL423]
MFIAFQYFLLTLQLVDAIQVPLYPPKLSSRPNNRLSKRSPIKLKGDVFHCFRMEISVNGVNLKMMVDSGSFDTIVPFSTLNNYNGPSLTYTMHETSIFGSYDGVTAWEGHGFLATVRIQKTSIIVKNAPVIGIFKQSTDSPLIDGNIEQGILGLAYPSLAEYKATPPTVMDALYDSKAISNNEVGLHLCPYELSKKSYIDIGNTNLAPKCGTNGNPITWIYSPTQDYFTVDIKSILINGNPVTLPNEFQVKTPGDKMHPFSIIDTCTTTMDLPHEVVAILIDEIVGSDAFEPKLDDHTALIFFWERYIIKKSHYTINWKKLPVLSFVMSTGVSNSESDSSIVKITLGPKDYIQKISSTKYLFSVSAGSNKNAVLGTSFMARLKFVLDREHVRIGLGPGCGCEKSKDGYPTIEDENKVLWSPK